MPRHVTLEVLGQKYSLYTEASDEDVQEILNMVKNQIEAQVGGAINVLPSNKAAILTSLNVASEYVKLKKDFAQHRDQMGNELVRIIDKIEQALQQE